MKAILIYILMFGLYSETIAGEKAGTTIAKFIADLEAVYNQGMDMQELRSDENIKQCMKEMRKNQRFINELEERVKSFDGNIIEISVAVIDSKMCVTCSEKAHIECYQLNKSINKLKEKHKKHLENKSTSKFSL